MSEKKARIYLRALESDDYKTSIHWRNDDEIWSMVLGKKYYVSTETEKQWVESAISQKDAVRLAICLIENDKYIGNIYLTDIDQHNKSALMGKLIGDKTAWGKGYATEAVLELLKYSFLDLGLNRVYAYQFLHNKGSIRANEKCGFVSEGIARKAIFKNGVFQDLNMMSILKDDYLKLNNLI